MDLNNAPSDYDLAAAPEPERSSARDTSLDEADLRLLALQRELVSLLARMTVGGEGSIDTAIGGLYLHRITNPQGPKHAVQTPIFAVIAQGTKRLFVGDDVYEYDPMHYLVSSVDLPTVGKVTLSSPDLPYLGLRIDLDTKEIGALIGDEHLPQGIASDASRGLFVARLDVTLLDAVLRLLRLLDSPRDIAIMAPMIKREILYRLLMNGQGALLRQTVLQDSQMNRIAKAIRMMKESFALPLRVEDIARDVHMSTSSLHHHFKVVTAMSPLQYQKNLRLQEARRLILGDDVSVAIAAQTVGYESSSQFSREYSRMFGAPPLRDKRRWQEEEAPVL